MAALDVYTLIGAASALERPWLSWVEVDGSVVIRAFENPVTFVRILPWHLNMHVGMTNDWVEQGQAHKKGGGGAPKRLIQSACPTEGNTGNCLARV